MTHKILITEDHDLYRQGLRLLLQEALADVTILEAPDFDSTLAALAQHPDISMIVLDIHLPGSYGLDGLKRIKDDHPALPVIVVSSINHQASIQQIMQAGADGFVTKSTAKAEMIDAFRDILAGELVVIGEQQAVIDALSPRQLVTLEHLSQGLANKEIAAQLQISPATVREYISDLLQLFKCENRTQLVLKARRLGFILD